MPETVGGADTTYQRMMNNFNQAQTHKRKIVSGYMDGQQTTFQNYFSYIADKVHEYTWFETPEGGDTLKRNIEAINRCFYPLSVEEIIENLKRENSPFSRRCLEQMERNSMLSMKLALKMVRDGKNLCYKSCL